MQARFMAALVTATVLISATAAPAQTVTSPAPGDTPAPVRTMVPRPMVTIAPMTRPSGAGVPNTIPQPVLGALALDVRYLRATRTSAGYRLSGQALVKDACTAARFEQFLGTIFPPQFNVVQFRRPGTMGMLCIQRLTWVTAQPLSVTSIAPPRYVTVRTQKGVTRVPILAGAL